MISNTKLNKVLTNPGRGQRLGTSSASWEKFKLAANVDNWKGANDHENTSDAKPPIGDHIHQNVRQILEQGPHGDFHILYQDEGIYEHWDWSVSENLGTPETSKNPAITNISTLTSGMDTEDCLVLKAQHQLSRNHYYAMKPYRDGVHGSLFLLYRLKDSDGEAYLTVKTIVSELYEIPSYLKGRLLLKVSTTYAVVGSENGFIYVFRISSTNHGLRLVSSHSNSPYARVISNFVLSNAKRELGNVSGIDDGELVLKTEVHDQEPIFDLVGRWLVYCPTESEVKYHRQLSLIEKEAPYGRENSARALYTPLRLPLSGPLINRVLSSMSNTAADNLFKLSDLGSKKMHSYLKEKENIVDKGVSLNSIGSSIGGALRTTVGKIKRQAIGEDDCVRVMDIENGQTMALFKPPGGVSHLSLNPHDLHLLHANYKGDRLYMWDLCKLPKEISLVGKFVRGKTSASIRDVVWFLNDNNADNLNGTNFGFGVITKRSGSVHWYNVNYLFGGNENNNLPNTFGRCTAAVPYKNQFSDSWILPSAKAVRFCKLPAVANAPADRNRRLEWTKRQMRLSQLAFIDTFNNMRLVSPLDGSYTFKYVLCLSPRARQPQGCAILSLEEMNFTWAPHFRPRHISAGEESEETPLSLAEIESCEPYFSLVNDKNIEFVTYDFGDDGDQKFLDFFRVFGMSVPLHLPRPGLTESKMLVLSTSNSENSTMSVATSSTSSKCDPPDIKG